MTDEQILQNAEQHVKELFLHGDSMYYEKNGFVAGAHSRDEEIESLQKQIVHLSQREQMLFDREVELIAENDQLRNPWISVEDDLPKISDKKGSISSEPVFVKIVSSEDGMVYHGIGVYHAYSIDKPWCIRNERDSVTHWMQIP